MLPQGDDSSAEDQPKSTKTVVIPAAGNYIKKTLQDRGGEIPTFEQVLLFDYTKERLI
jgi:hypothetical protein